MGIVRLNGQRIKVEHADLDGDGTVGGVEVLHRQDQGIREIIQPTELGETIKQLNDDTVDPKTRSSNIDLNTRLWNAEIPPMVAVETLAGFKVIPVSCLSITGKRKRLNVSRSGEGRKEIVSLVHGQKEHQIQTAQGGMASKFKQWAGFGG